MSVMVQVWPSWLVLTFSRQTYSSPATRNHYLCLNSVISAVKGFVIVVYHGGENDYLNNSKIILICNRTNTKLPGKLNSFRVGNGNFENSKLFEGPVIFEKKNTGKGKKEKIKGASHHRILFSLLSDMLFMLLTTSVQGIALNQCRWSGMEDNRSGRHVLDHRRC